MFCRDDTELEAWVSAIDQSTMRGIITKGEGDDYESTATNQAKRESYLSEHVKLWESQNALEREKTADELFVGMFEGGKGTADHDVLEETLGGAFANIERFCGVLDDVASCLPQRQDASDWFLTAYHKRVVVRFTNFVTPLVGKLDQACCTLLMSWLYSYEEALFDLDGDKTSPKLHDLECIETVLDGYVDHMVGVMRTWCVCLSPHFQCVVHQTRESMADRGHRDRCTNLLGMESKDQAVQEDGDGLHTNAPLDMFKMVNQQVGPHPPRRASPCPPFTAASSKQQAAYDNHQANRARWPRPSSGRCGLEHWGAEGGGPGVQGADSNLRLLPDHARSADSTRLRRHGARVPCCDGQRWGDLLPAQHVPLLCVCNGAPFAAVRQQTIACHASRCADCCAAGVGIVQAKCMELLDDLQEQALALLPPACGSRPQCPT